MICNNNISQYQNDAGIDVKPVSSSSFGDKNDLEKLNMRLKTFSAKLKNISSTWRYIIKFKDKWWKLKTFSAK